MSRPRPKLLLTTFGICTTLLLSFAAYWYHHYPKPPPPTDTAAALKFIASDDFRKLTQSHATRYANATLEQFGRESDFKTLFRAILNKDLRPAFENIRNLPDHEEINGTIMRIYLDRFYQQSKTDRLVYLTMIAFAQQGEMGQHPERFGLPSADKFKSDFSRFLSSQPPKVQAQMGQFLLDLRRQRETLGLKEPF